MADAVVELEEDEELDPVPGDEVVDKFVVLVVFVSDLVAPAGDGFTIVVLCSVLPAGDTPGVLTVSVFCSQPARSAAPDRMQMYFFIVLGLAFVG